MVTLGNPAGKYTDGCFLEELTEQMLLDTYHMIFSKRLDREDGLMDEY